MNTKDATVIGITAKCLGTAGTQPQRDRWQSYRVQTVSAETHGAQKSVDSVTADCTYT